MIAGYKSLQVWKFTKNKLLHTYFSRILARLLSVKHRWTNRPNLEMEPKYLTKSDIQLNPDILRTKNDKGTV